MAWSCLWSKTLQLTDLTKELFDYVVAFRQKASRGGLPDVARVQYELDTIFRSMEAKAGKSQALAAEYRQVKYPLVVLADEVILTSSWHGAKSWEQSLLETRYFSTNIAGNRFFSLLKDVDRMPTSVVTVFYYCLAFGFRGGFSQNDPAVLRLQERLLQRIVQGQPLKDEHMLPEAYRVDKGGTGRLTRVWSWSHLAVAALALFVVLVAAERAFVWPLLVGLSGGDQAPETAGPGSPQIAHQGGAGVQEQAAAPSRAAAPAAGYTVLLGDFKSEVLAKHYAGQMAERGVLSRVIMQEHPSKGPQYLVLSGTFGSADEASAHLGKAKAATPLVTTMSVKGLAEVSGTCLSGCP